MVTGVALVTGASRGIGRAVALRLADQGRTVAVNYRSDEAGAKETCRLIEVAGGTAITAAGDVGTITGVDEMFAAAEQAGPVEVLVNNAGTRRDGLAVLMKPDAWSDVIRTNLDGPFHATRRALRGMLSKRWGRIVNISSVAGLRGSPGQANYSAAKAGLIGMTRTLARELGAKGITVNAVAPGLVLTALTEELPADRVAAMTAQSPIGRLVTPEEVAAATAFLTSEEAAAITGQVLCVDGGMTA
ncbi:MAG TPA: 3-oxoacyl-ACP reductase FabG [Actinomycetota bacterium]|nr:3-oxoacyl-ACP reductase FabG [Actinomycetota bacterium]